MGKKKPKKVWLLWHEEMYLQSTLKGIFLSREKAEKAANRLLNLRADDDDRGVWVTGWDVSKTQTEM